MAWGCDSISSAKVRGSRAEPSWEVSQGKPYCWQTHWQWFPGSLDQKSVEHLVARNWVFHTTLKMELVVHKDPLRSFVMRGICPDSHSHVAGLQIVQETQRSQAAGWFSAGLGFQDIWPILFSCVYFIICPKYLVFPACPMQKKPYEQPLQMLCLSTSIPRSEYQRKCSWVVYRVGSIPVSSNYVKGNEHPPT